MALRALMTKKKLDTAKKSLEELRSKKEELVKREADIEKLIEEAVTEEEKKVVEEEIDKYEADKADLDNQEKDLEEEVNGLEEELAKIEDEQEKPVEKEEVPHEEERKVVKTMETRKFFNLNPQERDQFFAREDVQNYLGEVRSAIKEKRALTNVGLTIPEVFLGLIRENMIEYSKLYKHVDTRRVGGDARAVIMGAIPEAVWTECCANLNELALTFNDVELGCWKVAGYYAVCNANLEDSDIDLAAELIRALAQAIGYALDKAILYGTGTRMPLGVVTRLAQTQEPADYPATARPWADLHTANIKSIAASVKGADLVAAIVAAFGNAKGKYSRGTKVWVMNEMTYTNLVAASVSVDASGAIVAGVNGEMPVIGGVIEVLDFIPDNVIVGGYFDLYLLAERAGAKFMSSEHVRFLQDQTIFKGTARYDGKPAIAEAFVAIGLNGVTPNATMSFAADTANA
jgi:HK97 family phage major capsid protein